MSEDAYLYDFRVRATTLANRLNSPESAFPVLTFEFLCEHTVPKAGALALLQRTAARTQTEKRAIRQQSRQEEERGRKGTEKEAVGAKLVDKELSNGLFIIY